MTESIFARASSCYTCGFEDSLGGAFESTSPTMQRASVVRRHGSGSGANFVRSRSEERIGNADESLRELENQVHNELEQVAIAKSNTMGEGDDNDDDNSLKQKSYDAGTDDEDEEFHDAVDSAPPPSSAAATSPHEKIHRRAMSDPFDSTALSDGDMAEIRKADEEAEQKDRAAETSSSSNHNITTTNDSSSKMTYPTLPRYPVAATRDKNCWSEPPISIYSVRGQNYLNDKKKVPSSNYLLPALGCDLFLTEDENLDIGARSKLILGGHLRSLPTLAINFRFPWGVMILYYEIPQKLSKFVAEKGAEIDSSFTPSEKVFAKWLKGNDDYKNERLKLIPYVAEGPWVVRNMVTGRPAIIGKRLPVTYQSFAAENPAGALAPLVQCTLDIGSSSATAKRIVSVCRRYMSALTVDIGFVIQGDTADELPEQMLGSIRVHGVDPLKAPKL
mmetsp:Transcript_14619/g.19086  ORF Transcript_14619/g.19086 Transcript_14619/m.19086 type:complete len:447 (-) Transcript_14619:296-1636(-)